MANSDHFRSRAVAYRQLAVDSKNERTEGDMFEIANMFNCMAEKLLALELPRVREQARPALFDALRGKLPMWTL